MRKSYGKNHSDAIEVRGPRPPQDGLAAASLSIKKMSASRCPRDKRPETSGGKIGCKRSYSSFVFLGAPTRHAEVQT